MATATDTQLPAATRGEIVKIGTWGGEGVHVYRLTIEGSWYDLAEDGAGRVLSLCGNCPGHSGFLSAYAHIADGQCFKCNGSGVFKQYAETVEQAQKKTRTAVRRRATEQAKNDAKVAAYALGKAAWRAAHADFADRLEAFVAERLPASVNAYDLYSDDFETRRAAEIADAEYCDQLFAASKDMRILAKFTPVTTMTDKQVAFAEKLMIDVAALEAKRAAEVAASRHAGQEGEKVTVAGRIRYTQGIEGTYGYRTTYSKLVILEGTGACQGIVVKWVGTADAIWNLEKGQEVTLTGIVKELAEYKGVAETVLTRCKVA